MPRTCCGFLHQPPLFPWSLDYQKTYLMTEHAIPELDEHSCNRQTVPCQSVDIHNPHPWQHWTVHMVGTPEAGVDIDVMLVL